MRRRTTFQKRSPLRLTWLLAVVMALALAGCGGNGSPTVAETPDAPEPTATTDEPDEAEPLEPIAVTLSHNIGMAFAPILVARAAGLYEAHGLDMTYVEVGGGAETMAALLAGEADIGAVPFSSFVLAAEEGQHIQAVVPLLTEYASNMVVRKAFADQAGITEDMSITEKMERMRGANIGVSSRGSGQDLLWRRLLSDAGLDPDRDVNITAISGGAANVAALKAGHIDGFGFGAPSPDLVVYEGDAIWLARLSQQEVESLAGFLYVVAGARQEYIEQNPEAVQRFVDTITEALAFMDENPDEASDLLYETFFSELDRELWDSVWEVNSPAYPATPEITDDGVRQNFEFLEMEEPDDWEPFLNRSFLPQ